MTINTELLSQAERARKELLFTRDSFRSIFNVYGALVVANTPEAMLRVAMIGDVSQLIADYGKALAVLDSIIQKLNTEAEPAPVSEPSEAPENGENKERLKCPRCLDTDVFISNVDGYECSGCNCWFDVDEETGGIVFAYDHVPDPIAR